MTSPGDARRPGAARPGSWHPVATHRIPSADGVMLALHDLGGEGPPLLFCHPTGFHGMVWAPVAAQLAGDAHCWALDFRGHGDSTVPPEEALGWSHMAADVRAAVEHIGAERLHGAGHSMGATALFLAEQAHPGTWSTLWCYEPIVFPRVDGRRRPGNPLAEAARRRTAWFPDRETAWLNYASKPPLGSLDPAALDAYVAHGLRDRPDGSVELKCPPEVEAMVFENAVDNGAFEHLAEVTCPTTVGASGDGAPPAQMAARVAEALPHGRLERFPQLTHFGPMEDPGLIAASLRTSMSAG